MSEYQKGRERGYELGKIAAVETISDLSETIEALRAENAELKRLNGNCDRHIKEVHAAYMLEHSGLRAEIEKLRAALKEAASWLQDAYFDTASEEYKEAELAALASALASEDKD